MTKLNWVAVLGSVCITSTEGGPLRLKSTTQRIPNDLLCVTLCLRASAAKAFANSFLEALHILVQFTIQSRPTEILAHDDPIWIDKETSGDGMDAVEARRL